MFQPKNIFPYLYSQNHIPLWLLNDTAIPDFYTAESSGLRNPTELQQFFTHFVANATPEPALYVVNEIELFAFFQYRQDGATHTAVIGPSFRLHPVQDGYSKRHLSIDYLFLASTAKGRMLITPTVDVEGFVDFVVFALYVLQQRQYDKAALQQRLTAISLQAMIQKEVVHRMFQIREEIEIPVHSYEMEQQYLSCVRNGDPAAIQKAPRLTVLPIKAVLSDNPYKQFLYEMIALVTLVTRAAIEGGLDTEAAYTMSDLYIRQMDSTQTLDELLALTKNIAVDFAQKVKAHRIQAENPRNRSVQKAIEYIRGHLHAPIPLAELAAHVGLNDKYLSRLFLKETGIKLSAFIQRERVLEAQNLLEYSDYSLLEISNFLAFSSQSYFTKIFIKHCGMTPQQFRTQKQ